MVELKTTAASEEFDLIPEGEVVNASLESVTANSFTWNGEQVDKLRWVFTVTEQGPWHGKQVWGDTSTSFTAHPNCKAYSWVAAITGKKYADGEGLNTDDIIAMPCRIIIGHKKDDAGGRVWMRARDVLPASSIAKLPPDEAPF